MQRLPLSRPSAPLSGQSQALEAAMHLEPSVRVPPTARVEGRLDLLLLLLALVLLLLMLALLVPLVLPLPAPCGLVRLWNETLRLSDGGGDLDAPQVQISMYMFSA